MASSLDVAVGTRSGRLTVTGPGPRPRTVACLCDCGRTATLYRSELARGDRRHCGCSPVRRKPIEMAGLVFGELTVMAREDGRRWRVRCSCGTERVVLRQTLVRDQLRDCGCVGTPRAYAQTTARRVARMADPGVVGPMTLDEVATALGITRERVRQIEQSALRKLRAVVERPEGREVTRGPQAEPQRGTDGTSREGVAKTVGEDEIVHRYDILGSRVDAYASMIANRYSERLRERAGMDRPASTATPNQRAWARGATATRRAA